jgi:dUTP pyrophosphatase
MNLKYKKLNDSVITPSYTKDGDAGLNLIATSIVKNTFFEVWYNTDIAIEIPKGHFGMLVSKNSITNDASLVMSNSLGIIDPGFRGGIQIRFNKTLKGIFNKKKYKIGDKIAQLIIVPFETATLNKALYLSKTQRGTIN